MSKVIRLTSAENREWGGNLPQLVNKKGIPTSTVCKNLETEAGKLANKARAQGKALKQKIKYQDDTGAPRVADVECKIKKFANGVGELKVYTYIDGLLKVSTREIMRARFFKKFGECQLMRVNGKFLTKIRDPKPKATDNIVRATDQHLRHIPSPENCQCIKWGGRQEGRHHVVCEYNSMAPVNERGYQLGDPPPDGEPPVIEERRVTPPEPKPVSKPSQPEPNTGKTPSPEECPICSGWERPDAGKHHPTCEHYANWERGDKPVQYLVEVDSGVVVRLAFESEIADAEIARQRGGVPTISMGGAAYAVLSASQVPQAAVLAFNPDEGEDETPNTEHGVQAPTESLPLNMPSDEEVSAEVEEEPGQPRGAGIDASNDVGGLALDGLED